MQVLSGTWLYVRNKMEWFTYFTNTAERKGLKRLISREIGHPPLRGEFEELSKEPHATSYIYEISLITGSERVKLSFSKQYFRGRGCNEIEYLIHLAKDGNAKFIFSICQNGANLLFPTSKEFREYINKPFQNIENVIDSTIDAYLELS